MNWYNYLSIAFGVLGLAYAARFYWELRKWAHLIKYGRIVIAWKGKVRIQGTLEEWALWCRASEHDKEHQHRYGRELYNQGGTRVAVLHKSFVPDSLVERVIQWFKGHASARGKSEAARSREGTWEAEDHTVKS